MDSPRIRNPRIQESFPCQDISVESRFNFGSLSFQFGFTDRQVNLSGEALNAYCNFRGLMFPYAVR